MVRTPNAVIKHLRPISGGSIRESRQREISLKAPWDHPDVVLINLAGCVGIQKLLIEGADGRRVMCFCLLTPAS